jgi:hypothetical protein
MAAAFLTLNRDKKFAFPATRARAPAKWNVVHPSSTGSPFLGYLPQSL